MTEVDDADFDPDEIPRHRPSQRLVALGILVILGGLFAAGAIALLSGRLIASDRTGQLTEPAWDVPPEIAPPALADATVAWGLGGRSTDAPDLDPLAGGAAAADLDADGDLDLVIAHGVLSVYRWEDGAFLEPITVDLDRAMAVTAADVDLDGSIDLLVARDSEEDAVVWGGPWIGAGRQPVEVSKLAGTQPTSALLAAELSGDDAIDIVRLGRGTGQGEPDAIWVADSETPRSFELQPLGNDDRLSLAGELADMDDDGLIDVWVTRDVGWDLGGDSVYSRQGDASGPWVDIAPELGADLEVDGMGVTLADLDGDERLDAYVSDLGDNQILIRDTGRFVGSDDSGAARIRPPGAEASVVSSSWASGAADLNLDGRLDLVVANGGFPDGGVRNKIPNTSVAVDDPPAILIGIGGGRFVDAWPKLGLPWASPSRGMTIADFDGDGDDDTVFVAVDGSLRALRNDAPASSIAVKAASGCVGVGAVVTVRQGDLTYQALLQPHTFAGAHGPVATVGRLGGPARAEVAWVDGTVVDVGLVDVGASGAVVREEVEIDCAPSRASEELSSPAGRADLQSSGNRVVSGRGALLETPALDVELPGRPIWVLGSEEPTVASWYVVLESGEAVRVSATGEVISAERPPPTGSPEIVVVDGMESIVSSSRLHSLFTDPLPDARVVENDDVLVTLVGPTDRYAHGVLGDTIEGSAIEIIDRKGGAPIRIEIEEPTVVEGISPILADIDGDGVDEVLATLSNADVGAWLMAFRLDGTPVAESDAIGLGRRWRNQLAVAPVGPSGEIEIVDVRTPHIGGTVEYLRLVDGRLEVVARADGYTSHVINSRNLDMGIVADADGDGRLDVVVLTQDRDAVAVLTRQRDGVEFVGQTPTGDRVTTNIAARQVEGRVSFAVGTADGRLRIWDGTGG